MYVVVLSFDFLVFCFLLLVLSFEFFFFEFELRRYDSKSASVYQKEDDVWSTQERRVIAAMENYLDESDALELLMDQED